MITTEKLQLTKNDFLKILLTIYFKKRWWLFAWIWAFGLYFLCLENRDSFENFIMFFAIFYPVVIVIQNWQYANSKDNKLYLLERSYNINEDMIVGIMSDGTESPIKFEHFIKVIQLKRFYLIYITKNQFICLPKDSFKSKQDKEWFDKEIIMKIKK